MAHGENKFDTTVLSPFKPCKWWKYGSFFHCPNAPWFLQPEVMGIYLPCAGTLGCVGWPGAEIAHSPCIPSNFCPPHVNVGLSVLPLPQALLPYHLSAHLHDSVPPTHLDGCGFFKSLVVRLPYSSIFWSFWVLFVLRFGCNSFYGCTRRWSMPTPPFWLEVPDSPFFLLFWLCFLLPLFKIADFDTQLYLLYCWFLWIIYFT